MTKRFLILTIMLGLTALFGQDSDFGSDSDFDSDLQAQLKEKAVKIERLDSLGQSVYNELNGFKVIMLGEMHGTDEPANFLIGLAELFAKNGDSVQVGFEIHSDAMKSYLMLPTDSSVYKSEFFSHNSNDGRSSIAWANAIVRLTKNPRVKIFFYDINLSEYDIYKSENRDSLMYLKIKRKIVEHPNRRTITLSGNIHSMRLPYKEQPTTTYYLCNDIELNLSDKICTLYHYGQNGAMLNNTGNGLELRPVKRTPSVFSESLNFENYLFLYPTVSANSGTSTTSTTSTTFGTFTAGASFTPNIYNGIFFTKTVTASELVNKE